MSPHVSVVILTWNDWSQAEEAVTSVTSTQGVHARVIVVDNGSEPPARKLPGIHLLRLEKNAGVARGRNLGAAAANTPFICFLDSDALLLPETLARLVRALDEPAVAVAVPVFVGHRPEATAGDAPTLRWKLVRALNKSDTYRKDKERVDGTIRDVEFGIGACQVIKREVFEHLGGFDERYFYGPEDIDFCLRARCHGFRVVQVLDARCRHEARRSSRRVTTLRGGRHAFALLQHFARWRVRRMRSRIKEVRMERRL